MTSTSDVPENECRALFEVLCKGWSGPHRRPDHLGEMECGRPAGHTGDHRTGPTLDDVAAMRQARARAPIGPVRRFLWRCWDWWMQADQAVFCEYLARGRKLRNTCQMMAIEWEFYRQEVGYPRWRAVFPALWVWEAHFHWLYGWLFSWLTDPWDDRLSEEGGPPAVGRALRAAVRYVILHTVPQPSAAADAPSWPRRLRPEEPFVLYMRLRREWQEAADRLRMGPTTGARLAFDEAGLFWVLGNLDLRPVMTLPAADAIRWLLSRIEDEAVANLGDPQEGRCHPEIAGPLQALLMALWPAMERAGESAAWVQGVVEDVRAEQRGRLRAGLEAKYRFEREGDD